MFRQGEPHVSHDDQAQRVGGVFEALFQALFDLAVVDVGAQQRLVAGGAGHHDLDGARVGVGVVPVGAKLDNLVGEVHADVTARRRLLRIPATGVHGSWQTGHHQWEAQRYHQTRSPFAI